MLSFYRAQFLLNLRTGLPLRAPHTLIGFGRNCSRVHSLANDQAFQPPRSWSIGCETASSPLNNSYSWCPRQLKQMKHHQCETGLLISTTSFHSFGSTACDFASSSIFRLMWKSLWTFFLYGWKGRSFSMGAHFQVNRRSISSGTSQKCCCSPKYVQCAGQPKTICVGV